MIISDILSRLNYPVFPFNFNYSTFRRMVVQQRTLSVSINDNCVRGMVVREIT